jgi:hypothetical protein
MHPTSVAWRNNQAQQMTTEGFVELSYYFTDPNLQVGEVRSNNELTPISQSDEVINQHSRPVTRFATLEHNFWLLDGSLVTIPQTFPANRQFGGFISRVICNNSGVFGTPVRLDIVLSEPAVILPGLTIVWGMAFGEFPVDFSVIALNETGQQEIARTNIVGNTDARSLVTFEMKDVQRIRIEVSRWSTGNRRARIGNVFLGHNRIYTKDSLFAFSSSHAIDPVSARLPKYEISFEIDNRHGDFDPIDDDSISQYVMERQEITARYGFRRPTDGVIEWIPGGQYFLSDWIAPQNGLSASFRARDLLGFLDNIYHKGEFRGGAGISLFDLAERVLRDAIPAHLGNREDKWVIHSSLRNIRTISPLPLVTHAECLQLIANAAGATLTFDRAGILHIAPLPVAGNASRTLDDDNSYTRPEIDLKRPLKSVQVSAFAWQVDEEETVLYDEILPLELGRNEFIIEYSDTATAVTLDYEGSHMVESELFARSGSLVIHRGVSAPAECRIIARGRVIRPAETIVTVNNDDRGETLPLKNVLITDIARARVVANWLLTRYRNRKNVSVDWRVDPSMNMADFVALGNEQPPKTARILSTDFRFSGAFIGKSEGMVIQ